VQKSRLERTKKRRLMPSRRGILGSVQKTPFSPTNSEACKPPLPPIWGLLFEGRSLLTRTIPIPSPLFALPDGTKGRAWLANDDQGSKIIGDDRLWRVNIEELLRKKERRPKTMPWTPTAHALRRPIIVVGRSDPVRDVDNARQRVKGFKIRICIEAEKELQVLGCGWRVVTCQFRRNKVLLHRNGNVATIKRKAFKELLSAVRATRPKRRRPSLRLVVSNPKLSVPNAAAA
jgi:hypothetical protein